MLLLIWCNRFNQAPNVAQILMVTTRVPRIIYTFCIHLYFFYYPFNLQNSMSKIAFANVEHIVAYADLEQEGRVGMGVLGKIGLENRPLTPPPTLSGKLLSLKPGYPFPWINFLKHRML